MIFTDRESGVVSLGKKAQWRTMKDGMFTPQGLGLVFFPSLGSSHQFHSTVEVKVKSIKEALGKLDLTRTSIDCISLSHKLNILASRLNDVPIICRIRSSDRTNMNNILTRNLTPNILCMRKTQGFITSQDPKLSKLDSDNKKLVKQMDELAHEVMVLIHRNQREKDIQETAPEIGTLVCFMNNDRKFTHLTSRLRYGLITGLSQPSMDNAGIIDTRVGVSRPRPV